MPRSRPRGHSSGDSSGGDDGGSPPPPRRPRPSGGDGDPESISAAEARVENKAGDGRGGSAGRTPGGPADSAGRAADVPVDSAGTGGPPWPVSSSVPGSARGRELSLPHRRHSINGSRNGWV